MIMVVQVAEWEGVKVVLEVKELGEVSQVEEVEGVTMVLEMKEVGGVILVVAGLGTVNEVGKELKKEEQGVEQVYMVYECTLMNKKIQ